MSPYILLVFIVLNCILQHTPLSKDMTCKISSITAFHCLKVLTSLPLVISHKYSCGEDFWLILQCFLFLIQKTSSINNHHEKLLHYQLHTLIVSHFDNFKFLWNRLKPKAIRQSVEDLLRSSRHRDIHIRREDLAFSSRNLARGYCLAPCMINTINRIHSADLIWEKINII